MLLRINNRNTYNLDDILVFANGGAKMFQLIKKDILFNFKYFVISLGFVFGFFIANYFYSQDNMRFGGWFIFPWLAAMLFIGKMCYTEDNASTRMLLKSLPVKKLYIVLSKYVEATLFVVIAYVLMIIYTSFSGTGFNMQEILVYLSLIYICIALYTTFFHVRNYNDAQMVIVFFILL
ncbi:hypothetical protein AZF37_08985 [endosymbiont 'TC1' of Trimyema compressum]|nr:hypothetical protein AZF37_08985 [endosymbiont 'TC1' of Trimyema compressum]